MSAVATNFSTSMYTPAAVTTPTAKAADSTTGSSASNAADGNLDSTFLSLLVKELQNQDPTAPMDSTAMVGQMISLNQLNQLIGINQTLGGAASGTTPVPAASSTVVKTSPNAAATSPATAAAAGNTLPFDPNTMMPVGTTPVADINSPLNAAAMGFPGTTISGGK